MQNEGTLAFNKKVVRRYMEEAFNRGNLSLIDELCSSEYIIHCGVVPPAQNDICGIENLKKMILEVKTALPDVQETIEDMIAEGDKVVVRYTVRGTHTGAKLLNCEPEGNSLKWTGIGILRVVDGVITEEWYNEDTLAIMQQLDVWKKI